MFRSSDVLILKGQILKISKDDGVETASGEKGSSGRDVEAAGLSGEEPRGSTPQALPSQPELHSCSQTLPAMQEVAQACVWSLHPKSTKHRPKLPGAGYRGGFFKAFCDNYPD